MLPVRAVLPALLSVALAACTSSPPRTENTADTCSNGRDDDGDSLVDCSDPACSLFSFCARTDAGPLPDAGALDAPLADGEMARCVQPIDVVFVLDVSSSMPDDLMRVRDAVPAVFDEARRLDPTASIGLAVFVDDVLVVNACSSYANAGELTVEIDRRIASAPENLSPVSARPNQDCRENALDAIFDAATMCTWRAGAEHTMVLVTDDTFAERPAVLSGEWGPGVFVATTYTEAITALSTRAIRLVAVAQSGAGDPCGAGTSPDVGQGFFGPYLEMTSIPEATAGVAIDLREVRSGAVTLGPRLADLLCD